MSGLWQTPVVVLTVLTWLASPPASIGEAAQRETLRRLGTPKATASLTYIGLPPVPPPASVTEPPPTEPPPVGAGAVPPPPEPPQTAQVQQKQQQDEQWWRTRMAAARSAIEHGQLMAEALQSRISALQADAVNLDDPVRQAKARTDLGKALGELDRTTKQVGADRKAMAAIQEEARRLNVPAGWVR